jgi:hypothetical protein
MICGGHGILGKFQGENGFELDLPEVFWYGEGKECKGERKT